MGRIFSVFDDVIRVLAMSLVLLPAARLLSRRWGGWTANALSLVLMISPKSGIRVYYQMRQAFGNGRLRSLFLTWRFLSQPFRDFVFLRRIEYGREDPTEWRCVERNADAVRELRESGESYILATAHFLREGINSWQAPSINPGQPIHVMLDLPDISWRPSVLRVRMQYGALIGESRNCTRDVELAPVRKGSFRTLCNRLRERGNVVVMHVDAPWSADRAGSYTRPFAGQKARVFAVGAARLARLAQCPIVSFVYWMERDGTFVFEWGTPTRPLLDAEDDDVNLMNELVDRMEVAIGENPTQYILPIGGDRRWNPGRKRWED
jgi:lauroyl/myristoyl acyltransferase